MVAAGRSERLGASLPKPYLRIGGRTVLGWSLRAFAGARSIRAIVVVAAPEQLARARRIAAACPRVVAVVAGGARRQDSASHGLAALPAGIDPVLVHDAARPLVTPGLIEAVVRAAARHGAAIAASPLVDTLKWVEGTRIRRTLSREGLWRAETPQGARRSWMERAFARATAGNWEVTDEAMLIERIGRTVHVVPSPGPNPKLTAPADVPVIRALLRERARGR